jgi:hypothetical protein
MTDEEASDQADRVSAALRDTILQLNDDGLDPQCIVEALIVQAVGLAFAEYGGAEGQYLIEGTVNACLREAARLAPPRRTNTLTTPACRISDRVISKPKQLAASAKAACRVPNPRAGRQNIFETDPALFRRTPLS